MKNEASSLNEPQEIILEPTIFPNLYFLKTYVKGIYRLAKKYSLDSVKKKIKFIGSR